MFDSSCKRIVINYSRRHESLFEPNQYNRIKFLAANIWWPAKDHEGLVGGYCLGFSLAEVACWCDYQPLNWCWTKQTEGRQPLPNVPA